MPGMSQAESTRVAEKLLAPKSTDGLTPKERRFVEEYPVDLNATQAARRAGYSHKSAKDIGSELLHKPKIIAALGNVLAKRSKEAGVNRAWVLTELVATHEKVKAKETVGMVTARLKCLELIGRHVDVRAFGFKTGVPGDDDGPVPLWDLSRLDDEEFEIFERLLVKISVARPIADGAGTAGEGAPPPPDSGA